ncbi:hypothetical protein FRC08_017041 [Ceratobasidium sp. 394]|nr:hypothetical protein FRC08_017041 [Ceratobasidium sp. 394]
MDPDDKVRAAVCKVFSQIDYEAALHHVSKTQLQDLAGRCLDRKPAVRHEAFNSIGRLYSLAYPEIESNDLAAIPQFAWIPEKLLEASAMPETRDEAEKCISEFVLPLPAKGEDVIPWTERLLLVMKYLSGGYISKLLTLTNLKSPRPSLHERFVQSCVDYNGGVVDKNEEEITKNLNGAITLLTAMIPESAKQREDLQAFAKLNESRLYKLLRTCMDPQTDLKTLIKTTSEFQRRLEQSSSGILETMSWFLRRASLHIVNQSSVPTLVKKLRLADTPNSESQAVAGDIEGEPIRLLKAHLANLKSRRSTNACRNHCGPGPESPGMHLQIPPGYLQTPRWRARQGTSRRKAPQAHAVLRPGLGCRRPTGRSVGPHRKTNDRPFGSDCAE